jgi:hypothetical protein
MTTCALAPAVNQMENNTKANTAQRRRCPKFVEKNAAMICTPVRSQLNVSEHEQETHHLTDIYRWIH